MSMMSTNNKHSNKRSEALSRFKSLLFREVMRKKLQKLITEKPEEKKLITEKPEHKADKKVQVPFVTSPTECVMKVIEMSKLTPNDVFVDIGCGDGRLLIAAAKMAKCKCIGIEIEHKLICKARQSVQDSGTSISDLVQIINCDFKSIQCRDILKQANVVFMYLMPYVMPLLTDILIKSVKDGCRVISYKFDLGRLIPKPIENMRITKWSYPTFGSKLVWMKFENKIFMTNLHPDFETKYGIKVDKLEFCQLLKVNDKDFNVVSNEYDFILAQRYICGVVSNYYQFRQYPSGHKLDVSLRYRYKRELYGDEYETFRDRNKWFDTFEAVKPNQMVEVINKTDVLDKGCHLKLYIFPLAETDFGWKKPIKIQTI